MRDIPPSMKFKLLELLWRLLKAAQAYMLAETNIKLFAAPRIRLSTFEQCATAESACMK
jgi:hypothetical protein